MDCFQDFCLFCDSESHDGPYCSQACKLADLERSSGSTPTSPTSNKSSRSSSVWHTSSSTQRPSTVPLGYTAPSSSDGRQSQSSYFIWNTPEQSSFEPSERVLTPSSSGTSLSSTLSLSSSTSPLALSSQAKQDLHGYFNSFDQARAAKRRSSTR